MRHSFTSAIILLGLALGGFAPLAHADTPIAAGAACSPDTDTCVDGYYCSYYTNTCVPNSQMQQEQRQAQAQAQAAAGTPIQPPESFKDSGGILTSVMTWIASLFGFLLGLAIITLNYATYYTVVTMGNYVHGLSAIGVTWRVLRDIGNILLIFGFLAAGFMTILRVEKYGFGTKMLPKLLLAAIFLNFSLFFAEAIIDTGNLFAAQFYAQINGGNLPTADSLRDQGISGKIMQQLGLEQIYNGVRTNGSVLMQSNPLFIGFMSIILFLVAAFVFFSLAFMLIARFVVLIILIIVAPIGFAGWAFPKLEKVASSWWSTLLEQTATAPVLFLLLYIALALITDKSFLGFGATPDWLGLFKGNGADIIGYASVLISFLVAMGLLLVVLLVAKKMSAVGADWATQTAGKVTFGTTALAGRYTGGWLATKSAKGLRRTWVARVPLAGTGLVKGLEKVGASSFDVRGTKTTASALKTFSVDAGKPQTGGYKKSLDESIKKREEYAKDLKGRELTEDEKIQQTGLQTEIGALQKKVTYDRARQIENEKAALPDPELNLRLEQNQKELKKKKDELDKIESVTDVGAQRKYATTLGRMPLNILTSNREASKNILKKTKMSDDAKALDSLKKALKKVQEEEGTAGTAAAAAAGTTPPAGGVQGGGTPPSGGAPPAGGGQATH